MKVLIADDESVVLEGLKYIIDWDALGFSICSQASNGEETLNKILISMFWDTGISRLWTTPYCPEKAGMKKPWNIPAG